MPDISLTEFVDFAIKAGTPKLTHVKKVKKEHIRGYHPTRDYYRKLRDGIVEMHRDGMPKSVLDGLVKGIADQNKTVNYPLLAAGYKKFLGRKSIQWYEPPKASWFQGNLEVRINPELGLEINGRPHLIKLYFKAEKLTKARIELINHLMLTALDVERAGATVGMLDVRNGNLIVADSLDPSLAPLLNAEAIAFCEMYKSV